MAWRSLACRVSRGGGRVRWRVHGYRVGLRVDLRAVASHCIPACSSASIRSTSGVTSGATSGVKRSLNSRVSLSPARSRALMASAVSIEPAIFQRAHMARRCHRA